MAAVNTSVGVGGSGTSLTTGSVTPSGSNTAVYAATAGDASYASDAKYNGSGGTSLSKVSADQAMAFFGGGHFNGWGAAGSPTSSTTGYASWGATSQGASATSYVFLTGVDPTTPFGSEQTANNLDAPVTSIVASRSLTGLNPGQLVVAGLGVLTFAAITVTANNGSTTVVQVQQGSGGTKNSTAILYGVADGSGNLTLSALIDQGATSDLIAWALSAVPVNDAAGGGGSTISAAAGAATASSATGASTAVSAEAAAAGVATAGAMTGSSSASATRASAVGVATTSARAATSTAVASMGSAAGAASTGTLSSTPSPSVMGPADGVASASVMLGRSTAVASFVQASGSASASALAGSPAAQSTADVPGIDISFSSAKTPKWWARSGQEGAEAAEAGAKPQAEPKRPKQVAKAAREQAKKVIEAVAQEHAARGDVPKPARFAELRGQIKPLGKEATGFNWPALYEQLYAQALNEALRQELQRADALRLQTMQEEEALLLLLAEA